ncbi:hypothetical protein CSOJ01_02560 [Colletotrichum sojae]|uniref:Uncharacterized protein n=1 Tax=Colletotrichum sojae TaxID=2175907 RepID=A0A8H6JQV4_9PEZI|nr:hypothetical protein CSOJ01_02560 [Colletotrichum sojae]
MMVEPANDPGRDGVAIGVTTLGGERAVTDCCADEGCRRSDVTCLERLALGNASAAAARYLRAVRWQQQLQVAEIVSVEDHQPTLQQRLSENGTTLQNGSLGRTQGRKDGLRFTSEMSHKAPPHDEEESSRPQSNNPFAAAAGAAAAGSPTARPESL